MNKKQAPLEAKLARKKKSDATVNDQLLLYHGYADLKQIRFEYDSFSGKARFETQRECLIRRQAAALLPYDPIQDKVVLLQQVRVGPLVFGANPWMLEIVAGVADKEGESLEDLARRETFEEAGLACDMIEPIHQYFSSPGCSNEYVSVFCGRVEAPQQSGIFGVSEEGEDIKTIILTFDETMNALQSGFIDNSVSIIALQWLQIHRNELRKKW